MASDDADPFCCAGCGKEYAGERMQCDCATGVGIRRSDRMQIVAEQRREVRISFDEYQTLQTGRAAVAELAEALQEADAAIKEWFRYLHGGEMRGSYDGKPEREMLRKAGYRASAILSRHQAGLGKGEGG